MLTNNTLQRQIFAINDHLNKLYGPHAISPNASVSKPVPGMISTSTPFSVLKASSPRQNSLGSPTNTRLNHAVTVVRGFQRLRSLRLIGTASISRVSTRVSGPVQAQTTFASGNRRRSWERIARRVLSLPKLGEPKCP